MTQDEIQELAGHRQVPAWVVKLVGDCLAKEREQKPAGWLYRGNYHALDPSDWARPDFPVVPLYTHPQPKEQA